MERVQDLKRVEHDDFQSKFKTGLVEVVYEWAKGMVSETVPDVVRAGC